MAHRILLVFTFVLVTSEMVVAQPLRLTTGEDFPPMAGSSLPGGGMATEIVQAVFEAAGFETEIEFMPWERGIRGTQRGSYDATFPYIWTAKRSAQFLYSDPFYVVPVHVFAHDGSGKTFTDVSDLEGATLCIPLGFARPSQVVELENAKRLDIRTASSMEDCLDLLVLDRVDFVPANALIAGRWERENYDGAQVLLPSAGVLGESSQYLIISRAHPDGEALIRAFNRSLAELREQNVVGQIIERHLY